MLVPASSRHAPKRCVNHSLTILLYNISTILCPPNRQIDNGGPRSENMDIAPQQLGAENHQGA